MGFMSVRQAGLFLAGIALGGTVVLLVAHRGARDFQARAVARAPRGFLVAEARLPGRVAISIDLAKSFGTNPGDPVRYYAGSASTADGSVSFSYPPAAAPILGDVILVQVASRDGADRNFVVRNGDFGPLFQNREFQVTYAPQGPDGIVRPWRGGAPQVP